MKNAVEQFNALNGKKVKRSQLVALQRLALDTDEIEVADRIYNLLVKNPKPILTFGDDKFHILLKSKIKRVSPGATKKNKDAGLGCPGKDCNCGQGLGADGKQLGLFGASTITVSSDHFKKMKVSELRKFALDYYNKFLNGKEAAIKGSIQKLEFITASGRKIARGGSMYKEKAAIIEHFESIVKNSTYNNWGDKKNNDTKDVLGYLNFKSKLTIDKKKCYVRITVVVYKDRRTLLKNYEVGKTKNGTVPKGLKKEPFDGETKPASRNKNTKTDPKGKKGLGQPIVLDGGKPYFRQPSPERKAANRDVVAPVLEIPVKDPIIVSPKPEIPIKTRVAARTLKKNGLVQKITNVGSGESQYYDLTGDLGRFLGNVEIKPKESVVVTLDAPQGAMKTRLFFQLMNMYAMSGYNVLFLSLEEHPDSALFKNKRDQYLSPQAQEKIDTVGELPNGIKDFHSLVPDYDILFIDSWGKLTKKDKGVDLDNDIRKRYNGKKFFTIYQRTTSGSMRGGAASQFDGDMIMKIKKDPDSYENNYAYWDKNRYESEAGLKYNIFREKIEDGESSIGISGNPVEMV